MMSDAERITAEWVNRIEAVGIEVDGNMLHVMCVDDQQAVDLRNSLGLLLADKIAGWRRVLADVPSDEQRSERLQAALDEARLKAAYDKSAYEAGG